MSGGLLPKKPARLWVQESIDLEKKKDGLLTSRGVERNGGMDRWMAGRRKTNAGKVTFDRRVKGHDVS